MNKQDVQRNKKLEIRMTQEEKDLFYKYAEDIGINPARLARNLILSEAESILNQVITKNIGKAYIKTKELLKDKDFIERMKKD